MFGIKGIMCNASLKNWPLLKLTELSINRVEREREREREWERERVS